MTLLEIHEPGEAPMDELKVISDAWLTGKNVREKGFSLGRFSEAYIRHFRVAIIRFEGKPVAFANLLETHSHELSSLDLMRAHPDAPKTLFAFQVVSVDCIMVTAMQDGSVYTLYRTKNNQ